MKNRWQFFRNASKSDRFFIGYITLMLVGILIFGLVNVFRFIIFKFNAKVTKPVFEKAQYFHSQHELDSATYYFHKSIELSRPGKNPSNTSASHYWLARCMYEKKGVEAFDSIFSHARGAIFIGSYSEGFEYRRNLDAVRKSHFLMAEVYEKKNAYLQIEKEFQKALAVSKKFKDKKGIIETVSKILKLHRKNEDWYSFANILTENLGHLDESTLKKYEKEFIPIVCDFFLFAGRYSPDFFSVGALQLNDSKGDSSSFTDSIKDVDILLPIGELLSYQALSLKDSIVQPLGSSFVYLENAIHFQKSLIKLIDSLANWELGVSPSILLSEMYIAMDKPDSALIILDGLQSKSIDWIPYIRSNSLAALASAKKGEYQRSFAFLEDTDTVVLRFQPSSVIDAYDYTDAMIEHYETYVKLLQEVDDSVKLLPVFQKLWLSYQNKEKLSIKLQGGNVLSSAMDIVEKYQMSQNLKVDKFRLKNHRVMLIGAVLMILLFTGTLIFVHNKQVKNAKHLESSLALTNQTITLKGNRQLKLNEISFIEKESGKNKVIYWTVNKETIEEYNTLNDLEFGNESLGIKQLPQEYFIRTHQSFIINRLEVFQVLSGNDAVKMNNGEIVKIARRNRKRVLEFLNPGTSKSADQTSTATNLDKLRNIFDALKSQTGQWFKTKKN